MSKLKPYLSAITLLLATVLITRIMYYVVDPTSIVFRTPRNMKDKLIESAVLITVMLLITVFYIIYLKSARINKFIVFLWVAVIVFASYDAGPYVIKDYKKKKYQKMMNEEYAFYKTRLGTGYSIISIDLLSQSTTVYLFMKNSSITKHDLDYLIRLIKPLGKTLEDDIIIVELISTQDNMQTTMRYTANKQFSACDTPYFATDSYTNICFE